MGKQRGRAGGAGTRPMRAGGAAGAGVCSLEQQLKVLEGRPAAGGQQPRKGNPGCCCVPGRSAPPPSAGRQGWPAAAAAATPHRHWRGAGGCSRVAAQCWKTVVLLKAGSWTGTGRLAPTCWLLKHNRLPTPLRQADSRQRSDPLRAHLTSRPLPARLLPGKKAVPALTNTSPRSTSTVRAAAGSASTGRRRQGPLALVRQCKQSRRRQSSRGGQNPAESCRQGWDAAGQLFQPSRRGRWGVVQGLGASGGGTHLPPAPPAPRPTGAPPTCRAAAAAAPGRAAGSAAGRQPRRRAALGGTRAAAAPAGGEGAPQSAAGHPPGRPGCGPARRCGQRCGRPQPGRLLCPGRRAACAVPAHGSRGSGCCWSSGG